MTETFDDRMRDIEAETIAIAQRNAVCSGCGQRIEALDHALLEIARLRSGSRRWRHDFQDAVDDAFDAETELAGARSEIERLRAALLEIVCHWNDHPQCCQFVGQTAQRALGREKTD